MSDEYDKLMEKKHLLDAETAAYDRFVANRDARLRKGLGYALGGVVAVGGLALILLQCSRDEITTAPSQQPVTGKRVNAHRP